MYYIACNIDLWALYIYGLGILLWKSTFTLFEHLELKETTLYIVHFSKTIHMQCHVCDYVCMYNANIHVQWSNCLGIMHIYRVLCNEPNVYSTCSVYVREMHGTIHLHTSLQRMSEQDVDCGVYIAYIGDNRDCL